MSELKQDHFVMGVITLRIQLDADKANLVFHPTSELLTLSSARQAQILFDAAAMLNRRAISLDVSEETAT